MNLKDLKKQMVEESESQIVELPELAASETDKIVEEYEKYYEAESKKDLKDRRFFEDGKGGVLVLLRMPKKSVAVTDAEKKSGKKGQAGYPKETKSKSIQWWGPKIVDMKGRIATCFFPLTDDWKKVIITKGLWEEEEPKNIPIYLLRGIMKTEYRWISDPETKYARSEEKIIAEAKKEHPDLELNTIEDVIEALYSELDRFKYTFNASELLKVY